MCKHRQIYSVAIAVDQVLLISANYVMNYNARSPFLTVFMKI